MTLLLCLLRCATVAAFAYLCAGELLPLPILRASPLFQRWATQQVALLALLSGLAALLAVVRRRGCDARGCGSGGIDCSHVLAVLNVAPIAAAIVATRSAMLTDNCPVAGTDCQPLALDLDAVGLISARLARLDLGISVMLAARGGTRWLLDATNDALGYAEAIPLHRTAGWWCAGQSALHSAAYLLFYPYTGGLRSLWLDCFPVPLPDGALNRLGLVNGLGILALVALLALVASALPPFRRRSYHAFQRLHAPLAASFVVCSALHDLPVLLFAVPGMVDWYLSRGGDLARSRSSRRRWPASAATLPGTSGPWVELTIECGAAATAAPRGQWLQVRVVPLGPELHPLSVTLPSTRGSEQLSLVVSARAGDWSQRLADLSQSPRTSRFEVELAGPFAFGGGRWSLNAAGLGDDQEPALLLLAGGTGVTGWLPALAARDGNGAGRKLHLVWSVQSEADYLALAGRLPATQQVTIYVTRAAAPAASEPLASAASAHVGGSERAASGVAQGMGIIGSSTEPSTKPLLSVALVGILAGLATGHWGWECVRLLFDLGKHPTAPGWHHQTLLGFFISRRCLPIALIVASMLAATVLSGRVFSVALTRASRKRRQRGGSPEDVESCADRPPRAAELGAVRPQEPLFTGVSSTAPEPAVQDPAVQDSSPSARSATDASGHRVQSGRPDYLALVRAAAAGPEAAGAQRLVVAACGPPTLVAAARKAVADARKECLALGVRLEFSGVDSRW